MNPITLYRCGGCHKDYNSQYTAVACCLPPLKPTVGVGDIVVPRAGFGWFDGDPRWISNKHRFRNLQSSTGGKPLSPKCKRYACPEGQGNCFGPCCTLQFYYVVTVVDRDPRDPTRPRHHLYTKAMSGKQGYRHGWTYDEHHCTPVKVPKPPAFVVGDSKDLLGVPAKYLL